ncbi:uncharacterized protein LOC108043625 [Drosophila rhopaloa]|uniref:Uncharacterized protein n=1 Tax=Drosophila rhopaloa TaxID=1041015 RepID=A0ABM5JF35_DRORH|nr:uncharacterized protein LOC108043625 [Drosophila rhopaloa]
MKLETFWLIIILKAGLVECGLKSHAELIRQAIKIDNKIKDIVRKVTGFAKGNLEFKESYENLRIPLMENYTSLNSKLVHVREFEAYNNERLQLEQSIILAINKLKVSSSENCEKLNKNVRKELVSKLTDTNTKKREALKNLENRTCQNDGTSKSSTTSLISTTEKSQISPTKIYISSKDPTNIDDYEILQEKGIYYLNKYHEVQLDNKEFTLMKEKLKFFRKLKKDNIDKLAKAISDFEQYDKRRLILEDEINDRIHKIDELIPYQEPRSQCLRFFLSQKRSLQRALKLFNDTKSKRLMNISESCPFTDFEEENDDDEFSSDQLIYK